MPPPPVTGDSKQVYNCPLSHLKLALCVDQPEEVGKEGAEGFLDGLCLYMVKVRVYFFKLLKFNDDFTKSNKTKKRQGN
jgi:hypothetical protein